MTDDRLRAVETAAVAAHTKIDTHEAKCGERWKAAHDTMAEVKAMVKTVNARLWTAASAIITLLLAALGKTYGLW